MFFWFRRVDRLETNEGLFLVLIHEGLELTQLGQTFHLEKNKFNNFMMLII